MRAAPAGRIARRRILWALAALAVACVFLVPFLAMLAGSFRQPGLPPPRGLELIPASAGAESYRDAFGLAPLARSLRNSALVAVAYVPLAVTVSSLAGFAIASVARPLRRVLVAVTLLLLMVPVTAVWIPRFALFDALGLVGTFAPLVAPALTGGSPLFVLLYAYAFRRIPADVLDAARLEGASPLRIWRRVAFPLVRATTTAVALLAFVQTWSNFIDPLLYLDRESTYTAPIALRYLEQLGPTNWPVLLAGSVVVAAPAVLAFAFAQRRFLQEERGIGWLGR